MLYMILDSFNFTSLCINLNKIFFFLQFRQLKWCLYNNYYIIYLGSQTNHIFDLLIIEYHQFSLQIIHRKVMSIF